MPDPDALLRARLLTAQVCASLPKSVSASEISDQAKLPFKAVCIRELLIHRVAEVATAACRSFEQSDNVTGCILVRSALETTAATVYLWKRISAVVTAGQLNDIDTDLMKLLVGARWEGYDVAALNVLTLVDHADKEIPRFREAYNELSEVVHPNWSGLFGSYAVLEQRHRRLVLGKRADRPPIMIAAFPFALAMEAFVHYYNELGDLLPAFIGLCEREIANKAGQL